MESIMAEKKISFKDSKIKWFGEIPIHWKAISNKYIFRINKVLVGKRSNEYTLLSLTLSGIIKRNLDNPQGKFPTEYDTYQEIKKGDFVFCLFDVEETPRTVGLSEYNGMITGAYTVLRSGKDVDEKFLYYFYLNLDIHKRMKFLYTGLRNTITKDNFFSFKTLIPPLSEQIIISGFIDKKTTKIDEAIVQKEKLIELLKEHKQILIHNAVTRGLDPTISMKDSGHEWIKKIPRHWEVKRLKTFTTVQSGLTLGKVYREGNLIQVPYLRVANVQDGFLKLDEIAEISIPPGIVADFLLRKNDILVTEGGDIDKLGRGTIWNDEIKPCAHQNHVFAVRIESPNILPQFIAFLFACDYGKKYFTTTANKTTNLASTNKTKLGNFPTLIIPLKEQKEILDYIRLLSEKMDLATAKTMKQIEKLKEYKSTLINSAVTGKIKTS